MPVPAALDPVALAREVAAGRRRLTIHPLYLGYQRRDDGWSLKGWQTVDGLHLLFVVHAGSVTLAPAGAEPVLVGPGTAFLLRPDAVQDVAFSVPVGYHEVYFDLEGFRVDRPLTLAEGAWALGAEIDALADDFVQRPAGASPGPVVRHALALLLARFAACAAAGDGDGRRLSAAQRIALVHVARDCIGEHLSPETLAAHLGLGHDDFTRRFTATFGRSPRRWFAEERMREACRLLRETDLDVGAVCRRLGYRSQSSFGRQFREVVGLSPGRFRRGPRG